jgi:hypothetical protein
LEDIAGDSLTSLSKLGVLSFHKQPFFKSKHGLKTKKVLEIVSGVEIFKQSTLLKYKLTVKFLAIFI